MPILTWKRILAAVLFAIAMSLLVAGILGLGDVYLPVGGVALVLVVGLVVIATYRRSGHNMHQVAEQQRMLLAVQEKLDVIARKVMNVDETLRKAGIGDLRPLVLGAFRDVSGQIGRFADKVDERNVGLRERLHKLDALLSSVEGSTKAMSLALDRNLTLLGGTAEKFDVGHRVLGERLDTLEEHLLESVRKGGAQILGEVLPPLEGMACAIKATPRRDELEALSTGFLQQRDDVLRRLEELDQRADGQFSGQWEALERISTSLKAVADSTSATPRREELVEALSTGFIQQRDDLLQRLEELDQRTEGQFSDQWSAVQKNIVVPLKQLSQEIGGSHLRFDVLNDLLSMESVNRAFHVEAIPPIMTGWSLEPAALARLLRLVLERKPRLIVECGSGVSTVWLGYAARQIGAKVIALEHLEKYAQVSREEIHRHGLGDHAEIRLAELEKFEVSGEEFSWYSRDAWHDLARIDLLLVDGPPKATGHHARYPAVPLLHSIFSEGAIVILDDVNRKEELDVLVRWRDEFPSIGEDLSIGPRTVAVEWQAASKS